MLNYMSAITQHLLCCMTRLGTGSMAENHSCTCIVDTFFAVFGWYIQNHA